ncbi:DEAD/DEAH box helicase family protein [Thermodesulfobium sp. 4217-1]|uniref:type III restriction-modification system endonuclease n=1 Tax=Thermodesulfobium sp. 4217-1 TaxID=3120013 RepID=UPI0032215D0C
MNFRFKKQAYQLDAVKSVVDCFKGQSKIEGIRYRIDPGKERAQFIPNLEEEFLPGFKNSEFTISKDTILESIQRVQRERNLPVSDALKKNIVCDVNLDVEMETGTGKTYVYTRTCFELNKEYGWNKFIIVVPSIAIREGVYQSIELTREHFLEEFGKQAKAFIYNSKELHNIESFSSDAGINIMIINVQAFNATGADNRRIYDELDEFSSRRPIDVIKANRPILIIDEPQKIEGNDKKESKSFISLKEFNPLFILRYSATLRRVYNKVYRLDALDAYNQKLVKKISVKGISVKGLSGTNAYLYLQNIEISSTKPPVAKLEIEIKKQGSIKRDLRILEVGDDLFIKSNELEEYRGYVVSEIDAYKNKIFFKNGLELSVGDVVGDISEDTVRRIQIRETIKAHLEREKGLFNKGIKVLSLFFIDEVAKYRVYNDENEKNGEYAKIFEEEYDSAVKDLGLIFDKGYEEYLNAIKPYETHNGYFARDKKGNLTDPKIKLRGEDAGEADDVDAYDLILKDKKRLLSFEEKTRFIFSHSALREGWDNPNVFVICALRHSENTISRRQEVGRGMRICVNKYGERLDDPISVHDINVLTVVANESYKDFVSSLQKEISETLSERPRVASAEYFSGKIIHSEGEKIKVSKEMADKLEYYLIRNGYVDENKNISEKYHEDKKSNTLAPLPESLKEYGGEVFKLVDSVFSESALKDIVEDSSRLKPNPINDANFGKKQFQELWQSINKKAIYTVNFDSRELIDNAKNAIERELLVSSLEYTVVSGTLEAMDAEMLKAKQNFEITETENIKEKNSVNSGVKYDLVGKIASNTNLTRKTVGQILAKLSDEKFSYFQKNPEEFISEVSRIISDQKASMVIQKLVYTPIEDRFDTNIFTLNQATYNFENAKEVKKNIYKYLVSESNVERDFADSLDASNEVIVYAKLPKGFAIPTPVGDYNPDWAIVFKDGRVQYIYFIAETKGSMSSLELRKIEEMKIECAERFFEELSSDNVKLKYGEIDNFETLWKIVAGRG